MSKETEHMIEAVIGRDELLDMTRDGWEVVESYEVDDRREVTVYRCQKCGAKDPCSCAPSYAASFRGPTIEIRDFGRIVVFRVQRPGSATDFEGQIAKLHEALREESESLRKQTRTTHDLQEAVAEKAGELRTALDSIDRQNRTICRLQDLLRSLEGDLGAIRDAIGSDRYEEIVARNREEESDEADDQD